jgi:8-oxo-dGTP diphosphatase
MLRTLNVAIAIIRREDRVMICRRKDEDSFGGYWEFPGGKVEPGEDPAGAVVREIREELGCHVAITRALPRFLHDYGTVVIEMIPYVCALSPASPAPQAHEHVALAWVAPADLPCYDLAAADLPVLAAYRT